MRPDWHDGGRGQIRIADNRISERLVRFYGFIFQQVTVA
jgi:hypothetical protein